jgi:hypothetical protein
MNWNRQYALTACAVIVAGAFAGGCGSGSRDPGVASAGTRSNASSGPGSSGHGSPFGYSQCMRSHGVPNFPDPTIGSGGGFGFTLPQGIDPRSPQFQAADHACKSQLPGRQMSPAQRQQATAAALRMSQCMRAHGITDFPDPNSQGGIGIQVTPGSDLDPNNPQFKAASAACQHLLPRPPGAAGSKLSTSGSSGSAIGSSGSGG